MNEQELTPAAPQRVRELLTASRQQTLLGCPRKHYWRYERKLVALRDSAPLRFGSAFHRALESRFNGADYAQAFEAALGSSSEIDEFEAATLSALLAAYYDKWGEKEELLTDITPEVSFRHPIERSLTFDAGGKVDGVGHTSDGRVAIVEHKTAGEDIGFDSDYWQRLLFNPQLCQYVDGVRRLYPDVDLIIYDVIRKPTIRPLASVPTLDENGLKQVVDANGQRVLKKDGSPKQTADKEKGETILSAPETPDRYRDRLYLDATFRPDYYFARREVPVLQDNIDAFLEQRLVLGKMILAYRNNEKRASNPAEAWPRNCNGFACRNCEYASFCLQNAHPDENNVPAGFEFVADPNTELKGV